MDLAYKIVKLGRSARNLSNIKNRQPLSEMLISVDTLPKYYADIVKEELNVKKAEENARMVGGKILEDAEKSVENIKYNSKKTADARAGLIRNDIMRRASAASVDVAKNHIINELRNNPELHNKLIDESVDAINGVEI